MSRLKIKYIEIFFLPVIILLITIEMRAAVANHNENWLDDVLGESAPEINVLSYETNILDFSHKNIKNISKNDYNFAIKNPNDYWSRYLIGLYLLKNNQNDKALQFLKSFYMDNPYEITAINPLLKAGGAKEISQIFLPIEIDAISEQTVAEKYLNDFVAYDLSKYPFKITGIDNISFAITAAAVTIFCISLLMVLLWGAFF